MYSPAFSINLLVLGAALSDGILVTSSIITVIITFRRSAPRERVQLRFFTTGIIAAFAPLLFLTILPSILGLRGVDSQITTLFIILLPIAFGYSILRYQILVFDAYVRRIVKWILGVMLLLMLVYVGIILHDWLRASHLFAYVVVVAIAVILAPLLWWLAHLITEQVLFRESLYYRRLLREPVKLGDEALSLDHVAQLITEATMQAIETTQVCVFVFSEESGCYHLFPATLDSQHDMARQHIIQRLLQASRLLSPVASLPNAVQLHTFIEQRLHDARRPLLAYEVTRERGETPVGLERFFTSASPEERTDVLLAPIRSQGKVIGLLVLGERGDQQSYAGPEFEIIELLLARFAPLLEMARLQENSRQYTRLLNDLYQIKTISSHESQTLASIASAYASVAVNSLHVGVEVWIGEQEQDKSSNEYRLRPLVSVGDGPHLIDDSMCLWASDEQDWTPVFFPGSQTASASEMEQLHLPSCLTPPPSFPFAWLPLKKKSEEHIGVIVLTYGRPHQFLKEEIRLLEMFADQCATSLENASITIELRAAYERQKELDQLKDQFIMTASHELRTPLTAVVGYLELLAQYQRALDEETRADFITKAHHGCDELMLMVNNIMDANQMQFTIDTTKMENISLHKAVIYIVEILDSVAQRERRTVHVNIPEHICVRADSVRLHQIILNLLSNAFKYSPTGTPVEIDAVLEDGMVQTRIRDYGSGIPLEAQSFLFERFMRLERDMNSPVRGTGLGLYICKRLVRAMGGTIRIESSGQEGEGSTFLFTLHPATTSPSGTRQEQQSITVSS